MPHDILIRGGTAHRRQRPSAGVDADVAIADGRIAAIGASRRRPRA